MRVPGSLGDAGFYRESHEEKKTTVQMDQGTTKTLEPGSPVIKKEEGSDDRKTLGRSSVIEVKVEYEEKPKYPPPFVFSKEDNVSYNNYYGPGDPSLTVKTEKRGTPKQASQVTTQEQTVPKKTKMKKKHTKLEAPRGEDETDESEVDQVLAKRDWGEDKLEKAYHLNQLKTFLRKDPVMKTLKVKMLGRVHGPINPLPVTATDLETMKAIINLLREVGMIVGNFKAETLFDLGLRS